MDSENLLQSEYGNKRPFTVPENYFSELSSRVMAQMPAEEQGHEALTPKPRRALMRRLRPLAVAAMTIGVVLIGFLAYNLFSSRQGNGAALADIDVEQIADMVSISDDDFEQAADYFMVDEDDMYAYMAGD